MVKRTEKDSHKIDINGQIRKVIFMGVLICFSNFHFKFVCQYSNKLKEFYKLDKSRRVVWQKKAAKKVTEKKGEINISVRICGGNPLMPSLSADIKRLFPASGS